MRNVSIKVPVAIHSVVESPVLSEQSTNPIKTALCKAVQAYLGLRHGDVELPELYEVFRGWHPSVTPHLLCGIVRDANVSAPNLHATATPYWQPDSGRLLWGRQLVKAFRRPAPNQRRLLDEFQLQQWPDRISNPFLADRISVATAVEVLRNTVEALNDDHLAERLLRFGTRENCSYVYWRAH